jgi:hypothetical protein
MRLVDFRLAAPVQHLNPFGLFLPYKQRSTGALMRPVNPVAPHLRRQ